MGLPPQNLVLVAQNHLFSAPPPPQNTGAQRVSLPQRRRTYLMRTDPHNSQGLQHTRFQAYKAGLGISAGGGLSYIGFDTSTEPLSEQSPAQICPAAATKTSPRARVFATQFNPMVAFPCDGRVAPPVVIGTLHVCSRPSDLRTRGVPPRQRARSRGAGTGPVIALSPRCLSGAWLL